MSGSGVDRVPGHRQGRAWMIVPDAIGLVVAFVVLEWLVRSAATLPEHAYHGPIIAFGIAARLRVLLASPLGAVASLLGLLALVIMLRTAHGRTALRRVLAPWRSWEHGRALSVVILVAAGSAAWAYSTYAYNPYFGRTHLPDRMLLVALFAATAWRPILALPFVLLLTAIVGQLDHPVADFPWTEINLVVRVLVLFAAAHLVSSVTDRRSTGTFVFVLLCLIAVNYWWSGMGKLRLEWWSHRHLNLLLLGGYANGWATWLDPGTIVRISRALAPFNGVLMAGTLLVEWGALFVLWRRGWTLGLLGAAVGFHFGVFALTGMLFWKWIALEGALIWFLVSRGRIRELGLYGRWPFATSLALVLGGSLWVEAIDLSWYDTPLTYTVRLEGIGESGATYTLPNRSTAPYSDMFFLAPFRYLTTAPQITSVMGATGAPHERADSLVRAGSAEAVLELERRAPPTSVDPRRSERFDRLVASIGGHLNRRGPAPLRWLDLLRAPPHLWSFSRPDAYASQEPLDSIVVDVVLTFYDGRTLEDIERRRVRSIAIPDR